MGRQRLVSEYDILSFLANNNDGEYRSVQLLFADFLKIHTEYIGNQKDIRTAINSCREKGYIKNREYPDYFIYLTDDGRNQI